MPGLFEELGITDEDIKTVSPLANQASPAQPEAPVDQRETVQASKPLMFEELGIDESTIVPSQPVAAKPIAEMPMAVQSDEEFKREQNEQLAMSVFSPEELADIKAKEPIGFFEAAKFLDYEDVLPGGGFFQAAESANLLKTAKKLEEGKELSVGESELMRQFIRDTVEKNIRGYSIRGGIANTVAQMPAFAVEFMATAGYGKMAQKGAQQAASKVIKNAVLQKAAGVTAQVAARSALMPAQYVGSYGEERVNDFMSVTDKGNVLLKESTEKPSMTALKAFSFNTIEVGSEMSGAAIGKYVVKPLSNVVGKTASKYLRTPINSGIQKIPGNIREAIYAGYKQIKPNAKVNEVFTTAGFHGVLEELGEERVSQILSSTLEFATDEEITTEQWLDMMTPSKEQLLIEAGAMSLVGGIKGSATAVTNMLVADKGYSSAQAKEFSDNMTETEREAFIEQNLTVRSENETPPATPSFIDEPPELKTKKPTINNDQSVFEQAYRNWLDDLGAIRDATLLAKERGATIDSSNDAEQFARNSRGVMSTIHYNVKYGTTRIDPATGSQTTTGKGYKDILDDFDGIAARTETNKEARQKDFDDLRIAYSIIDDYSLSNGTTPKSKPTPKNANIEGKDVVNDGDIQQPEFFDEDIKVTEDQKLQADLDIARIELKYGEDIGLVKQLVSESTEYSQRVLLNLVDSGIISQELYDELIVKRPNFTSLKRVMDDKGLGEMMDRNPIFSNANARGVLKKRKGSEREIKDVNATIIENTARIIDAATRNRVARTLVGYQNILPEYIQKVNAKPGMPPKGTITVYENGKPQYYKVSTPLLKAMEGLTPQQLGFFEKFATGLTAIVRAGATTFNPNFIFANPVRDVVGSQIVSGGKANLKTFGQGIYAQVFKTEDYKNWLRDGGAFDTFMDMSDSGFKKAFKELKGDKPEWTEASKWPVIKQIHDLNTLMEQAPRIGLHKKLQAEGMEGIRAAQYARDLTLDFSRRGFKGGKANQYWAFLNAGLQGSNKLYRTMKEHPKVTIGMGLATVTMPSVFLTGWFLYGADEETKAAYLEIPQWQRDLFWIVPNSKAESGFSRVPKPFSFGFLFGSVPERLMISLSEEGQDQEAKKFWGELATGLIASTAPYAVDTGSLFPTFAKPMVELIANENFFRDAPIYPTWMDGLDPMERKNKTTSETSQALVEFLRDMTGIETSPAQLDHLIQGYTSTIGRNMLAASDALLQEAREMSGIEVPEKPRTASDYPISSAFAVREPIGSSSQSLIDFYDSYSVLKRRHATYKSKFNNDSLEEAQAYEDRYETEIYLFEDVEDSYYSEIKDLNKEASEIYEDLDMSGAEKLEELREINKRVTEIAQEANNYIKESKEE